MAQLFSAEWMEMLQQHWNNESEITQKLAAENFNATIACGFSDAEQPAGVLMIKRGVCTHAGVYSGEKLDLDMRAKRKDWLKWVSKGLSMTSLAMAYTTGKLQLVAGNRDIIKNPSIAAPFIKAINLMQKIDTE